MMTDAYINLEFAMKRFKEIHGSECKEIINEIDLLLHDALCNVDENSGGISAAYFQVCHDLKIIIQHLYNTY